MFTIASVLSVPFAAIVRLAECEAVAICRV
jgi:hypothetical protein